MRNRLCSKSDEVKEPGPGDTALVTASVKLSEAAAAFEKLPDPSPAVRLLKEEVQDVLLRVEEQHAQAGG